MLHIPKVFQCLLKSVRRTFWPLQMPPGIQIFARSPNAIISNEKYQKPSIQTLRNDEILKIQQVFKCFCEFRSTHILSSLNATRFPGFRAFTKCNKNQWKVTKTFKLATSKWRNFQYLTGFIMFFEHCCTALFDHFKCPPKSRLSVAHEMH